MLSIILKLICALLAGLLFYLLASSKVLLITANISPLETALGAIFIISLSVFLFMISAVLLIYRLFDR